LEHFTVAVKDAFNQKMSMDKAENGGGGECLLFLAEKTE
jgi:hypothetical protein